MSYGHLTSFQKKEENVLWSFDKFSKKGGKCPIFILTSFQKRRKMSYSHFDRLSKKGGKCPMVILANFQKKEENVL
jgi:hypothetical protein